MTKRRRMFVIWTCCACLWTPALYFVWLRVAIHSTSAWGAAAEQVFEFGAFRWCTLQHDPAKAAPALAITWGFDLAGAVLNLAMTAGLALIASPFVRWLVRNSALQGVVRPLWLCLRRIDGTCALYRVWRGAERREDCARDYDEIGVPPPRLARVVRRSGVGVFCGSDPQHYFPCRLARDRPRSRTAQSTVVVKRY